MNFPRRQLFKHLAQLFDLGVLSGSFVFAAVAVYSSPAGLTLNRLMSVSVTLGHGLLFAFLLVIWHNTFALCGLYNSQRLTPLRVEISEIFKAVFLASVLLFLSAKVFHIAIVKLSFVAAFWFCCGFVMASGRLFGDSGGS